MGEKLDKFKDDVDRLINPVEEENLFGGLLAVEEIKRQESQRSNSRLESKESKLIDQDSKAEAEKEGLNSKPKSDQESKGKDKVDEEI